MAEQAIKLKIGNKSYSLKIDSEKEECYRLAEREVNQSIAEYESKNFTGFTREDFLSLTALKFAINNIFARFDMELRDEDVKALESIDEQINSYLNDLTRE